MTRLNRRRRLLALRDSRPWLVLLAAGVAGCGASGPPPQAGEPGSPGGSLPDASPATDALAPPAASNAEDGSVSPDAAGGSGAAVAIFAAPDGAGAECTLAAPCTLAGAQAFLRALGPSTGDRVVNLRGGTYRLATPFQLTADDSGIDGHPVVYQAYGTEKPILSGAAQVTGFQIFDTANNIWRAPVPTTTSASRQLFVNGVRAERPHTVRGSIGFTPTARGLATVDADTTLGSWSVRPGLEVALDNAWKHMRCAVAAIEATTDATPIASSYPPASTSGTTLVVDPTCWANNETAVIHPGYPFNGGGVPPSLDNVSTVENVRELLGANGQTGQFYLDASGGFLYYVPRDDEDMTTADVELPALESLVQLAGTPGHIQPTNDDDAAATYSADWQPATARGFGDWLDDVHTTQGTGVAKFAFHGTGIDLLGELSAGLGAFNATLTDAATGKTVASGAGSETGSDRIAQQVLYSVGGLALGDYVLAIQKTASDGTSLVVDGFVVTPDVIAPVHDVTFRGVGFADSSWLAPSVGGYIDNQAGVLWDPTTHLPTRIPGAVAIHRGQRIQFEQNSFAHLGGAGLELADGTHDSDVTGNAFDDISGGAISVGEVDDYYLTDALATGPDRMTSGARLLTTRLRTQASTTTTPSRSGSATRERRRWRTTSSPTRRIPVSRSGGVGGGRPPAISRRPRVPGRRAAGEPTTTARIRSSPIASTTSCARSSTAAPSIPSARRPPSAA